MSEFRYTPPSHEITDSLLELAQDIEISKGRVSVATPKLLRQAADRVSRQQAEIERLRAALREIRGKREIGRDDVLRRIEEICENALGYE